MEQLVSVWILTFLTYRLKARQNTHGNDRDDARTQAANHTITMNDLLILLQIAWKHKLKVTFILCLSLIGVWLFSGEEITSVVFSRKAYYRIEFYTLTRLQRLIHHDMEDPGFVRLYSNGSNILLGESPIFDFYDDNTRIFWFMSIDGTVKIGRDIRFSDIPAEGGKQYSWQ